MVKLIVVMALLMVATYSIISLWYTIIIHDIVDVHASIIYTEKIKQFHLVGCTYSTPIPKLLY